MYTSALLAPGKCFDAGSCLCRLALFYKMRAQLSLQLCTAVCCEGALPLVAAILTKVGKQGRSPWIF